MSTVKILVRISVARTIWSRIGHAMLRKFICAAIRAAVEREANESPELEWSEVDVVLDETGETLNYVVHLRAIPKDQMLLKIGKFFGLADGKVDTAAKIMAFQIESELLDKAPGMFERCTGFGFAE